MWWSALAGMWMSGSSDGSSADGSSAAIGIPGGGDEGSSKCTISPVASTFDELPESVKKWYEENACKMEELLTTANGKIEEYNALVDDYEQYFKDNDVPAAADSSGDPADFGGQKLAVTYDPIDKFTETVFSISTHACNFSFDTAYNYWDDRHYVETCGLPAGSTAIPPEGWPGPDSDSSRCYAQEIFSTITLKQKAAVDEFKAAACELKELHDELKDVAFDAIGKEVARGGEDAWKQLDQLFTFDQQKVADNAKERAANAEEINEVRKGDLSAIAASRDFGKILFKEQCFLLAKIFDLVAHKRIEEEANPQIKKLPYYADPAQQGGTTPTNACLQMEGDPFGFINLLTQYPSQAAFFDMKTEEISGLQPMIRLFKVGEREEITDWETIETGVVEFQQEFMFDAYASEADVGSILTAKGKRGFGVGIKKFSFTYDGNNPFAAKKSIKAKLHIFANSFSELLTDRGGYKYADLALKTGGGSKKAPECGQSTQEIENEEIAANLAKLDFRLKAVVGWAKPSGNTDIFTNQSEGDRRNVLDALNNSFVTLNLTPTIHEFDIDEHGRVNFTINYLAYTEDFFDQAHFNIFYNRVSVEPILKRRLLYKSLEESCSSKDLAELKKKYAESGTIKREKRKAMRSLLAAMREANRIKYVTLSYDELKAFNTQGPFFEPTQTITVQNASTSLGTVSTELAKEYVDQYVSSAAFGKERDKETKKEIKRQAEIIKISLEANNPDANHVSFFYVSDLIDTILEGLESYLQAYSKGGDGWENIEDPNISSCFKEQEARSITKFYENFKNFRVLLGPLEIVDPKDPGHAQYISLGDVPISVKYFIEWLTDKISKKEQTTYSLNKFLNDFFNHLIRNFLNDDQCFTFSTKQKIRLNQASITSYKKERIDRETQYDEITDFIVDFHRWANYLPPGRATIDAVREYAQPPLLNIAGPSDFPVPEGGLENEVNYLIYSAGRLRPANAMRGQRKGYYEAPAEGEKAIFVPGDEDAGIFHYIVGRPRGIVKTIKLSKTSAPYLKEVRFEQEGYDGLEQLREVYDVQVDCFANVNTFPGTYIFVDPRGFAPDTAIYTDGLTDLTRYGIGGYCMIIRSENTFGPGEANTTLTTKWVAEVEAKLEDEDASQANTGTEKGTNDASNRHCDKLLKRASGAAPKSGTAP